MGPELLVGGLTGLMAYGNIQQGKNQQKLHDYNAKMLRQNADVENSQGNAREEAHRRQARQVLGKQAAIVAQSGGGFGGSSADIMKQSATNAELDSMMIRYESQLKSKGMKDQAEAEVYSGKLAKQQGYYNALSSILSGGSAYVGMTS